jgi:hypothetical protein
MTHVFYALLPPHSYVYHVLEMTRTHVNSCTDALSHTMGIPDITMLILTSSNIQVLQ